MKLELTITEINAVLQALGNLPYASVFELVLKIREQVQPQLAAKQGNAAAALGVSNGPDQRN
jgi:hypothetical protein